MEKNLNLIFESLPDPIKDWVGSKNTRDVISEICQKYNFDLEKNFTLSELIFRLVTQDLLPQNFVSEAKKELAADQETATELTRIIDEKILGPIGDDLLTLGIDRGLLYFEAPASLPAPTLMPTSTPPPPVKNEKGQETEKSKAPFLLHEEKGARPVTEMPNAKPSFVFKPPFVEIPTPQQPTKVTIERVVHYSSFYTALNRAPLKYYQKIKIPKSKWFS